MLYKTLLLFQFFVVCNNLLLSKSNVQMCENRGHHGHGDPKNLVEGKSCEKKLVVAMTVRNNQNETEKLHATISRVRDETSSEYGRLYNPFMIALSKSPVLINYPYFYTGFSVNNRPSEEIKLASGSWWKADSSKQCYDQWQSVEKEELRPSCGYQYRKVKKVQSDGTYKDSKERIWDSQGFCCHCSTEEKNANTFEEAKNYKRSGLNCKFFTSSSQASAHCMKMDKLWYTVHSFTESYRDFTIHIRAFDQIEKVVNDKTIIDYVNGGEIILSPSQKSGVGKYQRVIAHYVGDFAPIKSYPVLTERYFLIPKINKEIDADRHEQTKYGVEKYLILPMSEVDLRGGACNKVGVTYSSFKNQASGGGGFGCQQKSGYCLMNQPYNFFKEDEERLEKDQTPIYFPTRYGKLAGVKRATEEEDSIVLSFESEEDHVSLVVLQISADDVILIFNRASGEIVRAAINDFESLSLNGKLHVEVRNTGFVTADFYVSIPACSEGVYQVQEKAASINPQVTSSFVFSLKTSQMKGAMYNCIVQLFDSKRVLLAQRNVSFSTTTPCVCEEMGCRCECSEKGGVTCVTMAANVTIDPNKFNVKKKSSGIFGFIGNVFSAIDNMFGGLFGGLWKYIRYFVMIFVGVVVIVLLIQCGALKLLSPTFWGKLGGFSAIKSKLKEKAEQKKDDMKLKMILKKEHLQEKFEDKKNNLKEYISDKRQKTRGKRHEKQSHGGKESPKKKAASKPDRPPSPSKKTGPPSRPPPPKRSPKQQHK